MSLLVYQGDLQDFPISPGLLAVNKNREFPNILYYTHHVNFSHFFFWLPMQILTEDFWTLNEISEF